MEREREVVADGLDADNPDWHSLSSSTMALAELMGVTDVYQHGVVAVHAGNRPGSRI